MDESAASAIVGQWGAFGAVLVITWFALGMWILKQRADIRELQASLAALNEKRAGELMGFTDRVLKLAEMHNSAQMSQVSATESVATSLDMLTDQVKESLRAKRGS